MNHATAGLVVSAIVGLCGCRTAPVSDVADPQPAADAAPKADAAPPPQVADAAPTALRPRPAAIKFPDNEKSFFKQPVLFNFSGPNEKTARQSIDRFGPVGMSIELRLPPFQMSVKKIEDGSPAAATGKLRAGQRIESINGQVLKDIDPRIQLARIITDAEATDGKIRFMIKDRPDAKPEEVVVEIPVLGAYSETWPLNCPKSERVVRDMAAWVKEHGAYDLDTQGWKSLNGFGMLFLLSTGDEGDLDHVRGWVRKVVEQYKDKDKVLLKPWVFGPATIPLAEYYLRTGDSSILPVIQKIADHACGTMYNGGWSGRGGLVFGYMAGGHMNAAGVHVPTFLMLAKECGVRVDEAIMLESLRHLYRFAGKGSTPYGDGFPETYFIDNWKTGALAFTMAAAAALTPEGEKSVYAGARDISALRGFYGTNYMLTGHTGGGIGEVWRGPAMGLLYDKEPKKYRSFMNGRRWHLEMSRRFDGSFGILSGTSRYDSPSTWGQMMAFQYTVPRKTLRLTGAPRAKWSRPHKLPVRPWGTAADDHFCRIRPALYSDGSVQEFDDTLEGGTINGIERYMRAADGKDKDNLVLMYCHHPEHEVRREIGGFYRAPEQDHQIVPMLKHKDARVRRAGLNVLHHVHKGTRWLPPERMTDEMIDLVIDMVNDPEESWWCVENALRVMSVLPKERVAPHIDRLLYWLDHDEWWLQHSALTALAPLAVADEYSEKILPKIAEMMIRNTHAPATNPVRALTKRLMSASPKVRAAALAMFEKSYAEFPDELTPPAGDATAGQLKADMKKHVIPISLRYIAGHMMSAPGGLEALYAVAKKRHPDQVLPYKQNYLWADPSTFSPELKKTLRPIILEQVMPEFVTRNLGALRSELSRGGNPHCKIEELAKFYKKVEIDDYDWHNFGPDHNEMKWHYFSFDPEKKPVFMPGRVRHRKVTFPAGMEKWTSPAFDAAGAGWKTGLAPFANNEGKLAPIGGCKGNICCCGEEPHTFWEKEVLMIKGRFKFPPMKEGHSYRLIAGGNVHVGNTDGPVIYVNGRRVANCTGGIGRGRGGRPRGALLSPAMRSTFNGGEVEIAAIAFLRMHKRSRKIGNFLTVWMEEMKNPPVTDELAWRGLPQIAMQSSAWQQAQDTDVAELSTGEGLFRFDGHFVPDTKLLGTWTPLGKVAAIDEFKPGSEVDPAKPRYRSIKFKDKGFTDSTTRYWSGDTLMELGRGSSALKMRTKAIDGTDYLFIEAGGFTYYYERQHYKQPRTWHSPWFVLKRSGK